MLVMAAYPAMGLHQLLGIDQHWYTRDLMSPPHCLKSQYQHRGRLGGTGQTEMLFRDSQLTSIPRRFAFVLSHKVLFFDTMKPRKNIKLHTRWRIFASTLIYLDRKRNQPENQIAPNSTPNVKQDGFFLTVKDTANRTK
jgi:hypothetical protein